MFLARQSLDDLEMIKHLISAKNINDICAVCLQQHENHRTTSMQDMLPTQDEMEVYKILESISLFKYSVKTPQLLCATCSFKLLNIYEFQQMCNKSYLYLNNYINQKGTQVTYELEHGDAGVVERNTENEQFIVDAGDNNCFQDKVKNKQKQDSIAVISESSTLDNKVSNSTKILNTPTNIFSQINAEEINDTHSIEDTEDDTCKLEIESTEIHDLSSGSEGGIKSIQKWVSERATKVLPESVARADAIERVGGTNEGNQIDQQAGSTVELTEHGTHPKGHYGLDKKKSCVTLRKGTTSEFVCKYCNKDCHSKQALMYHENQHTGENPYKCDQCTKAFKSPSALKYHKVTHYTGERLYCECCGNTFQDESTLKEHTEIYVNRLSHVCSICSKGFSRKHCLWKHIRTHNSDYKPYTCKQCPKAYGEPAGLAYHKLSHRSERPYVCNICTKAFKDRAGLRQHMKYHVNARLYMCTICGKRYNTHGNLLTHMSRQHSNGHNNKLKACVK